MSKDQKKTAKQSSELQHLGALKPVRVIAVSAGKGGVGKSSVAINLSVALAQKHKKVLLLDADLALANIDIMLGLPTRFNLSHVIQGVCNLTDIMLTGPDDIKVIPAASGTEYMTQLNPMELAGIIDAFNELTDEFDYMIIDTAAGISDIVLSFIRSAQEVILLICDEPTSLTDAYALIKVMSRHYLWGNFHILANRVNSVREGKELFNRLYQVTDQFLDVHLNYLGAIPFDEKVHEAVKRQKVVLKEYSDSRAAKAFRQLADSVESLPFMHSLGGNTSFFIERLVAGDHGKGTIQ